MKNTPPLRYAFLALATLTLLFSCKKDDEPLKTPTDRILGTWNMTKESEKTFDYNTGAFKDSTGMAIPMGLYTLEFRTDGKVYEKVNDNGNIQRDTFSYQLVNEFLIKIDGEDYIIKKFTNNELHTTYYYDDGTSDVEHLLEFKK